MNNDLISRGALKEDLKRYFTNGEALYQILTIIDNAPTVEAVEFEYHSKLIKQAYQKGKDIRPQGEWVSKHLWDNTHVWVCSECGNRNTHGITVEKACWRCGADMRKGGAE